MRMELDVEWVLLRGSMSLTAFYRLGLQLNLYKRLMHALADRRLQSRLHRLLQSQGKLEAIVNTGAGPVKASYDATLVNVVEAMVVYSIAFDKGAESALAEDAIKLVGGLRLKNGQTIEEYLKSRGVWNEAKSKLKQEVHNMVKALQRELARLQKLSSGSMAAVVLYAKERVASQNILWRMILDSIAAATAYSVGATVAARLDKTVAEVLSSGDEEKIEEVLRRLSTPLMTGLGPALNKQKYEEKDAARLTTRQKQAAPSQHQVLAQES